MTAAFASKVSDSLTFLAMGTADLKKLLDDHGVRKGSGAAIEPSLLSSSAPSNCATGNEHRALFEERTKAFEHRIPSHGRRVTERF